MCNLSACHRAPHLWERPDSFHPQVGAGQGEVGEVVMGRWSEVGEVGEVVMGRWSEVGEVRR